MGVNKLINISKTQIAAKGVQALGDRPNTNSQYGVGGLSSSQLKLWFDKLASFLAEKINELQNTISGDGMDNNPEGSDFIHVSLKDFGIESLKELVDSFASGDFANRVLFLLPSAATDSSKQTLQAIINDIARKISENAEKFDNLVGEGEGSLAEQIKKVVAEHTVEALKSAEEKIKKNNEDILSLKAEIHAKIPRLENEVSENRKRIEIIEGQVLETISNTDTAYEKRVPAGVAHYATLNRVATMSHIPKHVICQHIPYTLTIDDVERCTVSFDTSSVNKDSTITVVIRNANCDLYTNSEVSGMSYRIWHSLGDNYQHYTLHNYYGMFTLWCDRCEVGDQFDLVILDYAEADIENVPDPRHSLDTEALVKIISLTEAGEQIDEYIIPEGVMVKPNYKKRLGEQCNHVDFDDKEYQEHTNGESIFAPSYRHDISEYLIDYDDFNFIKVEEGGKLIFENAEQGKVKSIVTYMRRNVVKDDSSGFEYILIDDAYYVSCGTAVIGTNLVIPNEYNGIKVRGIANDGFAGIEQLQSVTIPDGISVIGYRAFSYCPNLTNVSIPSSIEIIQEDSFMDCPNLTLRESDNGFYLGNNSNNYLVLFTTNKEIDTFEFKNTTKVIYQEAFKNSKVKSLNELPVNLTYMGWGVFSGCMNLSGQITVPSRIKVLENYTFNNCRNLAKITLPDSLTTIGRWSVALCTSLTEINIPESVTHIGQKAFYWCGELNTNLTIPKNTNIENNAFEACVKVKNIVIGHGVSIIPLECFKDCWELVSIKIPASILSIGNNAFQNCNKLETVYYPGHASHWNNIAIGSGNESLKGAQIVYGS